MIDWSQIKRKSRAELMAMLPKDFAFKLRPWKHQVAAMLVSVASISNDGYGFIDTMDMGLGKTKVAIDVFRFFDNGNGSNRVLVVCLNSAVENWIDEIQMNSDYAAVPARGGPDTRWAILEDKSAAFVVINYESLRALLSTKIKGENRTNRKIAIDSARIARLVACGFTCLIVDESHMAKSVASLNYIMLTSIAKEIRWRLLLTGTIFGNTLLDVWAQYELVDEGETFGRDYKVDFWHALFDDKGFVNPKTYRWIPKWEPTEFGAQHIRSKIFTRAIRYDSSEVEDMPGSVYTTSRFSLTEEQHRRYDGTVDDIGEVVSSENLHTLRTICSGFFKRKVDGSIVEFKGNPKLDLLSDLVGSIVGDGKKVVIFHEYIHEGLMIERTLQKAGIKFAVVCGRIKDKHAEWKLKFQDDGSYMAAVINPASGGQSINLTAASYCIFFSNGYSAIRRVQAEARLARGGQRDSSVHFYDLVANGTVEPVIAGILKKHKDVILETMSCKHLR